MDKIDKWISACTTTHTACSKSGHPYFKPTRLLDLGEVEELASGRRPPVRLINSAEHLRNPDISLRYLTLSHRWRRSKMPKLEKEKEMELRQAVSLRTLPKTFRHAIKLTRRLGIRYLWIDSLCIFQDSQEDWLNEAAKMADVYSNAYCNISAASADNGGLFFSRSPNLVATSIVRPQWPAARNLDFTITNQLPELIREDLSAQPLFKRGWVLQERLLANRNLHFTKTQVLFECRHHLVCETYPNGIPDPHGEICWKHKAHPSIHGVIDSYQESHYGESKSMLEWNRLVETYSTCDLTKTKDKLMALSGIAAHFMQIKMPGDQYLAGLWASQLPSNLLWEPHKGARKQDEYTAPSWSWASIDGAISMARTEHHRGGNGAFYADLTEIYDKVTTASGSLTGPVTAGRIRLFGVTAVAYLRGRNDRIYGVSKMKDRDSRNYGMWRPPEADTAIRLDFPLEERHNHADSEWQIPIVLIRYFTHLGRDDAIILCPGVDGLALRALPDGMYMRIGTILLVSQNIHQLLDLLGYPEGRWIDLI